MIELTINERTTTVNELMRKYANRYAKMAERDRWHWLVMEAVGKLPRRPVVMPIPWCAIHVVVYTLQLMDWDNAYGGTKFLNDALVSAKLIKDDNPGVVAKYTLDQIQVGKKRDEKVVVQIVPVPPA